MLVNLTNTILALFKMMSNIYSNFKKEKIGEAYLYLSYIYFYLLFFWTREKLVIAHDYKIIAVQKTVYSGTKNCV